MKTKAPATGPSMTFTTRCQYCGQKFRIKGWAALEKAMNDHRRKCKDPKKPRLKHSFL